MNEIENIRRQAAKRVLDELSGTLRNVGDRYERKHRLRVALHENKPLGINGTLGQLQSFIDQIRINTRNQQSDGRIPEEIDASIRLAEMKVQQLSVLVEQARTLTMDLRSFEIDDETLSQRGLQLYHGGLANLSTAPDALRALHDIWEEAFALVSGLCLRHEGLDGGLSPIADAIISEINWIEGRVFTVPGRGKPGMLSRVVHLAFPEWTIWALPLTAQGFWRLAARERQSSSNVTTGVLQSILEICRDVPCTDPELSSDGVSNLGEQLKRSAATVWGDEDLQDCLADVYGTFALGPAYACACICLDLALDPQNRRSEQRALAIFRTLATVPDFATISEKLERHWREAVPRPGTLVNTEWIDATLLYLNSMAHGFRVERWREMRSVLVPALQTGNIDEVKLGDLQFRHLLNAAWKARLENESSSITVMESFRRLSDRLLIDKRQRGARPTAMM